MRLLKAIGGAILVVLFLMGIGFTIEFVDGLIRTHLGGEFGFILPLMMIFGGGTVLLYSLQRPKETEV